jgi:serine/threonine-protein kinase RsbW
VSPGRFLLRMEFRSNPEVLGAVRGALSSITEQLGFSELEAHEVVLAVDEALTNIIRHTYHGERERYIEAMFRGLQVEAGGALQDALEIVLLDEGEPLDRNKLQPPPMQKSPIEERRPGGLGLHFISESMNEVEFQRRNGRNQLRLLKFLPPGKSQHAS